MSIDNNAVTTPAHNPQSERYGTLEAVLETNPVVEERYFNMQLSKRTEYNCLIMQAITARKWALAVIAVCLFVGFVIPTVSFFVTPAQHALILAISSMLLGLILGMVIIIAIREYKDNLKELVAFEKEHQLDERYRELTEQDLYRVRTRPHGNR